MSYNDMRQAIRLTAGGVVLNIHNQVCVVNQKHRSFSLPKGGVNEGEDILEAAKREVYEETGLNDLILVRKLGYYMRPAYSGGLRSDKKLTKEMHMFLFTTLQEELKPVDPDNPFAKWVHKNDVVSYLFDKNDIAFFNGIKDELP
jgi:8-oxo-dGTP pyrophosphatase MutT (NUDIX family)